MALFWNSPHASPSALRNTCRRTHIDLCWDKTDLVFSFATYTHTGPHAAHTLSCISHQKLSWLLVVLISPSLMHLIWTSPLSLDLGSVSPFVSFRRFGILSSYSSVVSNSLPTFHGSACIPHACSARLWILRIWRELDPFYLRTYLCIPSYSDLLAYKVLVCWCLLAIVIARKA